MLVPCTVQGMRIRGIFSFLGKRISPFDPQEKGIRLAVWSSNNLYASGMKMPARGGAALALQDDLAYSYYPLPLCQSRSSAA